jgi:ribosome-associated protein
MLSGKDQAGLPGEPGHIRVTSMVTIPESELRFEFSRSGGPGGQHVNKVSTRVDLVFDLDGSPSLDESQKEMIRVRLGARIDSSGSIRISARESRSQWQNRRQVVAKFQKLLQHALTVRKRRVASKPTAGSRERRVSAKKRRSQTKSFRGRVSPD